MLFSSLIKSAALATAMVGSAIAAPQPHGHNHHKRDLVVVTETQTVVVTAGVDQVVGGESTTYTFSTVNTELASPTSLSTTIIKAAPVLDASSAAFSYSADSTTTLAATTTSSSPSQEAAASTEAATSSASTSAASSTASTDSDLTSGKGITYSPYTSSGACKTLDEVKSDFSSIDGYQIIRLYGVDCSQVENVLQAKGSTQKLFLGIYYVDQIESGISQIASAIESYGSWDDIYTVSIGNELVNDGEASVSQVAEYISTGRSALESAGYTGPVVSVDTHIAIINNPGLCEYSDYIAINAHAYFDYNTVAADAGSWLLLQIERVWTACGANKSVFVTESGWPHQGNTYGVAIASPEAQAAAISSLKSTVGDDVILFTAFDDLWKADGAEGVEKYWGLYSS